MPGVIWSISPHYYYIYILLKHKQVHSAAGEIENVRVAVRLRPLSKKEKSSGCVSVVVADPENAAVFVQNPNPLHIGPPKTFMFDLVFDSDSKQVC